MSASLRPRCKTDVELKIAQKRDKEEHLRSTWSDQVKYYKNFERNNNRYEEWTSPRYYEASNQMLETAKEKRSKEDKLQDRRAKLKRLYEEEERSFQIEMTVRNRDRLKSGREPELDYPTRLLKEVYLGVRLDEEQRRRHEAEQQLYRRWRDTNPTVQDYERTHNNRQVKLSWLDRQIEKRMESEKAEEEARFLLQEREKILESERKNAEEYSKELEEKKLRYRADLQKQIEELEEHKALSLRLRQEEEVEARKLSDLIELQDRMKQVEKRRLDREFALANVRHHQTKLRQKASDIEKNLEEERKLIEDLLKMQLLEEKQIEAENRQLRESVEEFITLSRAQQELVRRKRECFYSLFDTEAKNMFNEQEEVWKREEVARSTLLIDIMKSVREQMEAKINKSREEQKTLLEERQNMLQQIEEKDIEMQRLEREKIRKNEQVKEVIERQMKDKVLERKRLRLLEQKRIEDELEEARKEEERLRKEIVELQRRPLSVRRSRVGSKFF